MLQNMIFKLGVFAIYIILVILFGVVGSNAPCCPEGYLNHIGSMLFCSSYIWNVIAFELLVFASIVAILYWEKMKKVHYPLAIFPSVILVIFIGLGTSVSAINGWVGAIGPETIVSSSIYTLPAVVVISTLVYSGLIIYILKRLFSTASRIKYWGTFLFAIVIYGVMIVQLLIELNNYLYQFGRA